MALKQLLLPNEGAYSDLRARSVFLAILESISLFVETQNRNLKLILEFFFF